MMLDSDDDDYSPRGVFVVSISPRVARDSASINTDNRNVLYKVRPSADNFRNKRVVPRT